MCQYKQYIKSRVGGGSCGGLMIISLPAVGAVCPNENPPPPVVEEVVCDGALENEKADMNE